MSTSDVNWEQVASELTEVSEEKAKIIRDDLKAGLSKADESVRQLSSLKRVTSELMQKRFTV